MADWTYAPRFDVNVTAAPPLTLQTTLDDGKVMSRVKHTNKPEDWAEEYWFDGPTFDTAKAFYDARGISTSFTKLGYDVYGTPTQERTVRFDGPWQWIQVGPRTYQVTLKFTRHY